MISSIATIALIALLVIGCFLLEQRNRKLEEKRRMIERMYWTSNKRNKND